MGGEFLFVICINFFWGGGGGGGGEFGEGCATSECLVVGVGNITLLGIRQIRLFLLSYKRRYKSMNIGVLYLVIVEVSQLECTSVKCKANYLQGEEGWEFFYHLLYHLLYPCFIEEGV